MQNDYTIKDLMSILKVSRPTLMQMLNDPNRGIKWYRLKSSKFGRPRIPASELEKLRTSKFANVA